MKSAAAAAVNPAYKPVTSTTYIQKSYYKKSSNSMFHEQVLPKVIWEECVARIPVGWYKLRQLVSLLTNKDISLTVRGKLYSSCAQSRMLHGSETWPVRRENEVAFQQAEIRMVRWMCGIKIKDRVPSKELRKEIRIR